ncbi:sigma-54 dependent transcriptional regulator [Myxococcota bacterium]|nr:sigma-54 dependent transcriptional regulator [Myxococcota bacterium]MBU1431534.1 sigma-54 dependent transcriptional regulator [Myxococcota bacterium]MBU1899631.1 sigma-54 dependent transcriptional regulator [Myxococcota bacterium]
MTAPITVLVVDDEPHIQKAWRWMLAGDEFNVEVCGDGPQALKVMDAHRLDVLVTDVNMPGMSGLTLLKRVKQRQPEVEVILMTGVGTIRDAVTAIQGGAFDYLTKPFSEIEECINKVRQAARVKRLREENTALRRIVEAAPSSPLLDSQSPKMRALLDQAARVARVDSNVLITGPTGVGKGVIAQAIHDQSARRAGPFVLVDGASLSSELAESALFGHRKGAFAGAVADRVGFFEEAHGGTLFLDEIGNLTLSAQRQLLRVLQEQRVRRVGAEEDIAVDVRVISATLIDLQRAIEAGAFRDDLYFRLKVVELQVPHLAARVEDIPRLAYHFMQRHATRIGRSFNGIEPEALMALQRHEWKGNIRELEHVIEAAMIFETGEALSLRHFPPEIQRIAQAKGGVEPGGPEVNLELPFREALEQADRVFRVRYLTGLMGRFQSVSAAARHAQMDRANFRRLLRRYEITDYPKGGQAGKLEP